jgi:hypothetical protein
MRSVSPQIAHLGVERTDGTLKIKDCIFADQRKKDKSARAATKVGVQHLQVLGRRS